MNHAHPYRKILLIVFLSQHAMKLFFMKRTGVDLSYYDDFLPFVKLRVSLASFIYLSFCVNNQKTSKRKVRGV